MIIENRSTEIGDVLYIKTDVPLIGLVMLSSFVDSTQGEYADRSFLKTFRYSVDGVTWTQYVPLTNDNIAGVQVQSTDTFYAEYRYERIGADPTGDLQFDYVTLNGQFILPTDGPAYLASNFNNYFVQNNICSIAWSVNVLEKLYKKGIIPNYIERNLTGSNSDDRDYIDFWRAITHYFALYVCLARQFQYFYQNRDLLLEYVKQRGLFVCNDISYQDLFYLMQNYYNEIRQRGTRQIFESKADDISVEGSKKVDGEYLRMICYDKRDEFLRNLNKNEHIGWNIGNSSPLYKGLEDRLNVNKYYIDYVDDMYDLNVLSINPAYFPFLSIGESSVSNSQSQSNSNSDSIYPPVTDDVIVISNPGADSKAGIGNGDKRIVINPHIDYEITFFVKTRNSTLQGITFGVNCYDVNDNIVNALQIDTLVPNNDFLVQERLNQEDKFYFVRGILFHKNNYKPYSTTQAYGANTIVSYLGSYYKSKRPVPVDGTEVELGTITTVPGVTLGTSPILWDFWQILTSDEVSQNFSTNLGVGQNLLLVDDIVKIDPYILYDNAYGATEAVYVRDIRVQPLSTPYSKGFLTITNLLEVWNTNNNLNLSEFDIERDAKRYLIPYNTVLKEIFIPSEINS